MATLTDISIRSLPAPESGFKIYVDDIVRGFGVRVTANAARSFVLTYGKARKRVTLGDVGIVKLADARTKARNLLAQHQLHGSSTNTTTYTEAYERFMRGYAEKNKPSTVEEMRRLLKRYLAPVCDGKKLVDITKSTVVQRVDAIDAISERRHFYTAAHTFFRWCRRYEIPNFLEGVEKPPKSPSRTRLITEREFIAIWTACLSLGTYGTIVRLLFATGQREGQIANLRGEWNRDQQLTFPPAIMKSNAEHIVPYGSLTASLLPQRGDGLLFTTEAGEPFNSWSDSKRALDKDCSLPHWVLHDSRRFFSSTHAKLRTPPHIRERLLAHKRPAGATEVEMIYDRYNYADEKREAVLTYESHLAKLLGHNYAASAHG